MTRRKKAASKRYGIVLLAILLLCGALFAVSQLDLAPKTEQRSTVAFDSVGS